MEKPATRFYIKETHDRWQWEKFKTFDHYLTKNKFYTDGWWRKKALNVVIWILKKLKLKTDHVYAEPYDVVMRSHTIHRYDLEQVIRKHKIDMDFVWHERPRFLVVGQDVFQELTSEKLRAFHSYQEELPIYNDVPNYDRFGDFYGGQQQYRRETLFWGFKVLLVPWINGCFLLPDV